MLQSIQRRFMYFPRLYAEPEYQAARDLVEEVEYPWRNKTLRAYLFGNSTTAPEKVWWLFGGNGSLALDWMWFLGELKMDKNVCVLVEYPGYGGNPGLPSPQTIRSSLDALDAHLRERWNLSPAELWSRSGVIGNSLGAAVALDTAVRFGARRAIAISPFTTMREMAVRVAGSLGAKFVTHHYDNVVSVEALRDRGDTVIEIYHGQEDDYIPIQMSQRLTELGGKCVSFFEIAGAGHNTILDHIYRYLAKTVSGG